MWLEVYDTGASRDIDGVQELQRSRQRSPRIEFRLVGLRPEALSDDGHDGMVDDVSGGRQSATGQHRRQGQVRYSQQPPRSRTLAVHTPITLHETFRRSHETV
jgi:hypothetical protein